MTRSLLAALTLLAGFIAPAAADQAPVSLDVLIGAVKSQGEARCEAYRQAETNAITPVAKEAAHQAVGLACDCLPAQIDRVDKQLRDGRTDLTVQKDEFIGAMQGAMNVCAARQVRLVASTSCVRERHEGVSDEQRGAYCACLSAGLDKFSDEQIAGDAQLAYEHFRAKVKARTAHEPDPAFEPTATEALERSCKPPRD